MKRKALNVLAVIAIIVVGILIINACSKSDSNLHKQKSYEYKEFVPAQEDVITLITTFNTTYNSYKLGLKSSEDVPLNEALWNLEAGVNYEFAAPKEYLNNFSADSTFVTVDLIDEGNGELLIAEDDLMNAYTDLLAFTDNQLNSGAGQDVFMLADVELKNVTEQQATFKMTTEKGHPSPPSCEIKYDDWWYWAEGLGKCGNYNGFYGQDASTRINFLLNCSEYSCPGGTVFFTNVDTDPYTYHLDQQPANNCNDNYYILDATVDAWDMINIINGSYPGKVYIDCHYTTEYAFPGNPPLYYHIIELAKFGVFNCKPDETK